MSSIRMMVANGSGDDDDDVIKTKCRHHNDFAITINDAAPW